MGQAQNRHAHSKVKNWKDKRDHRSQASPKASRAYYYILMLENILLWLDGLFSGLTGELAHIQPRKLPSVQPSESVALPLQSSFISS